MKNSPHKKGFLPLKVLLLVFRLISFEILTKKTFEKDYQNCRDLKFGILGIKQKRGLFTGL